MEPVRSTSSQPDNTPTVSGPLGGIVVLDLTQFLAGPYCTHILADLGARVIKIEPPTGDPTRSIPPHFVGDTSAYFLSVNHNKESVVIDLKDPEGVKIFFRLAQKAHIVVENFRPGVLARLGVDYSRLSSLNPSIVMCSITGFGSDGPYRDRPAYDIIVQALSGGMSLTGEPGGHPVRAGIPIADLAAGLFAVAGVLAALLESRATGRGRNVDIGMLDCQVSMLSYLAAYYLTSGDVPGLQGRGHVSIPTYRAFTCADGVDIVVAANTEPMWRSLCEVVGRSDMLTDSRFLSNAERLAHKEPLWVALEEAFRERSSHQWLGQLHQAQIPAAQVNTVDRTLGDPQVRHRNMVVDATSPDGVLGQFVGDPIKMAGMPGEVIWPPKLGEHTRAVLEHLVGLDGTEVSDLARSGTIKC
jgi:CoA:oxalate CoA-transferase